MTNNTFKAKYTNPLMFNKFQVGEQTLQNFKSCLILKKSWVVEGKSFVLELQYT